MMSIFEGLKQTADGGSAADRGAGGRNPAGTGSDLARVAAAPEAREDSSRFGLRVKSYFTSSVEAAVSLARQELGSEAILINSRKTPPELRHSGEYEVVFGVAPEEAPEPRKQRSSARTLPPPEPPSGAGPASFHTVSKELLLLRQKLSAVERTLSRSAPLASAGLLASQQFRQIYNRLTHNDVDPGLASDIVESIYLRLATQALSEPESWSVSPGEGVDEPSEWLARRIRRISTPMPVDPVGFSEQELNVELEKELRSRITTMSELGRGDRNVIVLVGPAGAGKTTTLVKLAVRYGLPSRRGVQILSIDNSRIAAAQQLASFASILGVGFTAVETPAALAQAIEEHRSKEIVLVDTPGFTATNVDDGAGLARFLTSSPAVDVHLVVPAHLKAAATARIIERFEVFGPHKLLFTMLDEADTFGAIFREAARTLKPVSFLSAGQQVPEDLEAATKERVLELVLGERDPRDGVLQ